MDPIHRNMQVYLLTNLLGSCVSHDVVISLIFFGYCVKFFKSCSLLKAWHQPVSYSADLQYSVNGSLDVPH